MRVTNRFKNNFLLIVPAYSETDGLGSRRLKVTGCRTKSGMTTRSLNALSCHSRGGGNPRFSKCKMDPRLREGDDSSSDHHSKCVVVEMKSSMEMISVIRF